MTKYRLINCDFLNASTFLKLSNKAKLLYYAFITNADDLGFVGNCDSIIETLTRCDDELGKVELSLLENDYLSAKIELLNKGYLYSLRDKYENEILVVKHWFMHNKKREGLNTNYKSLFKLLVIIDGEYYFKRDKEKNPYKGKEIKGNEMKRKDISNNENINKDNVIVDIEHSNNSDECSDEEWNSLINELENGKENNENGRTN